MSYEQLLDPEVGLETTSSSTNNLHHHQTQGDSGPGQLDNSQQLDKHAFWPSALMGFLLFALVTLFSSPYERGLTSEVLDDLTLTGSYKPNSTVPYTLVLAVMIILPLIFFYYLLVVNPPGNSVNLDSIRKGRFLLFQEYLKYMFGVALLLLATEVPKMAVGRLRPDFLSRCKPVPINKTLTSTEWMCSGDAAEIKEGRKSFPSGHSSSAFYVMSYLCLYYLNFYVPTKRPQTRSISSSTPKKISPLSLLMIVCAYLLAALVAISRMQDHKHHPTDVIAGSLLGLFISYFVVNLV